jgi:hypothetical protein
MSVSESANRLIGNSFSVALVCSLLSLVLETTPPPRPAAGERARSVAVTGAIDVTGKVLPVWRPGGQDQGASIPPLHCWPTHVIDCQPVLCVGCQGAWVCGATELLIPKSSWDDFSLETALPGEDDITIQVREWAASAVKPYTTLLEAVQATILPGMTAWSSGVESRHALTSFWHPPIPALVGGDLPAAPEERHFVGVAYTLTCDKQESVLAAIAEPLAVQVRGALPGASHDLPALTCLPVPLCFRWRAPATVAAGEAGAPGGS